MRMKWLAMWALPVLLCGVWAMSSGSAQAYEGKLCTGSIQVKQQPRADFPAMAKITPDQAMHKAEAAFQGKVLQLGLKNDNGFLVYDVKVVNPGRSVIASVELDAGTGTVLAVDRESVKRQQ